MKCLICAKESAGEVCDQCIRLEKVLFQKEWTYKEGLVIKKVEEMRVAVSSFRISGKAEICNNDKGMNGRMDNFSHYLMNVKECTKKSYNGKEAVMIHYINPDTRMERYLFLLGLHDDAEIKKAIEDAKEKGQVLVDRIRGTATGSTPASAMPSSATTAAPRPIASTPSSLTSVSDIESKAKKLKVLLDSGILSLEEYEKEKQKLLS